VAKLHFSPNKKNKIKILIISLSAARQVNLLSFSTLKHASRIKMRDLSNLLRQKYKWLHLTHFTFTWIKQTDVATNFSPDSGF
jgi:hypothetical protein